MTRPFTISPRKASRGMHLHLHRCAATLFAVSVSVGAVACSSAAEDASEGLALSSGDPLADDGAGDSAAPEDDRDDEGGGSSGFDDGGAPPDPAGGDDGGTTGAGGSAAGCPDPLPEGWIFCEDFEAIPDPSKTFFENADADGAFTIVDGVGASGHRSMEAVYAEGREDAGLVLVSFGESPIDEGVRPAHAPEQRFDEIWWRFRVRTQLDWPGFGPGRLTRAMAFASPDWSEAYVAHVRSAAGEPEAPELLAPTLEAVPETCITADAQVACAGYDDMSGLESLGGLLGASPIFDAEGAGQWHCVEVHMAVNTIGQADGVLEFFVDGARENGREDLDWRGAWDGYGINAVAIENFWPGGAPMELRRWIDDLVISTGPIGCD
jgi:hypothetical protein